MALSADQLSDDDAARLLAPWSGGAPRLLGGGMEGLVYGLDDERVAKIWFTQTPSTLRWLQAFYDALAGKPLSFATPRILEVHVTDRGSVSIERRLGGSSMAARLADGELGDERARAVLVDVVAELAASGPLPAGRTLPVLDENGSLYAGAADFPDALIALLDRRVARFGPVLARAVDGFAGKLAALRARLREVDSGLRTVVQGDLFPGNIQLDAAGRPTAVLDWGFLTTEGDPVFDAGVAAAIFDMYGPDALATELDLGERIRARTGFDRDAMLVYRAAYSLITATAYDPEGRDGHFAWCVAALNRADVARALLR
jgi:hypothetical protein